MKSKESSTNNKKGEKEPLNWNSPLESLFKNKKTKTLTQLQSTHLKTIKDLLWIFPLRVEKIPPLAFLKKKLGKDPFLKVLERLPISQALPSLGLKQREIFF